LAALFVNFLLMAQLSVSVGQIAWLRFAEVQFPAIRLTVAVGAVTIAIAAGTRHLGLPPVVTLVAGLAAATGTGLLAAWWTPMLMLGEYGVRMRDTLRSHLLNHLSLARPGGSA
jgi:hypothetical protein